MKAIVFFLTFLPCIVFGQCIGWYYPGTLSAEVIGDTVILREDTARRNCGAIYQMEISTVSDTIIWFQRDMGDAFSCDCLFNLSVKIDSLKTGHHVVKIYYTELEVPDPPDTCYVGLISFDILEQNSFPSFSLVGQSQTDCFSIGINNTTEVPLSIYPNPSSQNIHIVSGHPGKKTIHIYSLNYVCLFELSTDQKDVYVDIEDFPTGLYLIKIVENNQIHTHKLCKL